MRLAQVLQELKLQVVNGSDLEKRVTGGYASDLLSNVMAGAKPGQLWVTLQGHQNIVAVAVLLDLAAIVVAGGGEPDQETVQKAQVEGINLFTTPLPVFEIVGHLYQLGLRGL